MRPQIEKGWMTKSKNIGFFLVMGPGIAVFLIGIGTLIQHLPSKYLNVPHADHWRSAEYYPSACLFILKMFVILSIALVIFFGVTFHHVVQANQSHPPQLNNTNMGISTTYLLLFVGGWTLTLYYYFLRKPQK